MCEIGGSVACPRDPAAEGVVDGDTVLKHGGTAGAVGADVSEAYALGGGVGAYAVGAAEQPEAGLLPECVIER